MNSETLVINQVHKPSVEGKMNSETLVKKYIKTDNTVFTQGFILIIFPHHIILYLRFNTDMIIVGLNDSFRIFTDKIKAICRPTLTLLLYTSIQHMQHAVIHRLIVEFKTRRNINR